MTYTLTVQCQNCQCGGPQPYRWAPGYKAQVVFIWQTCSTLVFETTDVDHVLCQESHEITEKAKSKTSNIRTCAFLGGFANFQKAAISFVMLVRPFVRLHGTIPLPMDGFAWNLIHENFRKSAQKIQFSLKSYKHNGYFTWRTKCIFITFIRTLPALLIFRTEDYVTVKGKVHPRMAMKARRGSSGMCTLSLTSALDGVGGARGGVVVKALRYKPTGCGFESRWCYWNFSVT
jgi:hypothetical protein